MFFLAVILIGIISLFQLSVDLLPNLSYPRITIWTTLQDVGPREVEELVTRPIEEAISTVANIRRTHSVSRSGLSLVTVEFLWGTQMDFATLNIREKLDLLRWDLPDEAGRPNILRIDPRSQPIMALSLSGSNLVSLKELARNVYKRRLEQIKGVAMGTVTGGLEREIHVEIDLRLAQTLNISTGEITTALSRANFSITGGTIKKGLYRYSLRTLGEFQSVSEIEHVVVKQHKDGSQIRVRDIGIVNDGFKERQSLTRFNGKESIGLIIRKEAGANTVNVARIIKGVLDELRNEYPEILISVAYDASRFISSAISTVLQNLILGAILSFLILFIFLHDLRNPVNIALSIPISVIATFSLLYFSGISLNIMSIGGLALGVGMLVDNAIIVLENIFRHRQEGSPLKDAAMLGAQEVAMPITASTFTTIAIFLPVLYIYGVAGQLFRDQAVTVAFSLIASLLVALTLLPMLSCRFRILSTIAGESKSKLKTSPPKISKKPWQWIARPILWTFFNLIDTIRFLGKKIKLINEKFLHLIAERAANLLSPMFKWFDEKLDSFYELYHRALEFVLNNRKKFLFTIFMVFTLGILSAGQMNRQLMPHIDQGEFTVKLNLPVGCTLSASEKETSQVEQWLTSLPDVDAVFSTIGLSEDQAAVLTEDAAINRAKIQVRLKVNRLKNTTEIISELRAHFSDITRAKLEFDSGEFVLQQIIGSSTPPVVLKIRGSELFVCQQLADSVIKRISAIPGLKDIHSDYIEGQPEYRIEIDRKRASRYGLSVADVSNAIEFHLSGQQATEYKDFDRKISIIVRPKLPQRDDLSDLLNLNIFSGELRVPVRDLVTLQPDLGPSEIRHEDQNRQICVLANIDGRSLDAIMQDIQNMLIDLQLPNNYRLIMGGEQEEVFRSFRSLLLAMVFAVILIYMIMAAQFESLRNPFIILLDVPLTLSLLAFVLWVTGLGLNVISFIGLIVLAGIAVNDSIVKVDFINQRRKQGAGLKEAIFDASKKRFRPILMTSVTTIIGLLPMAIGFGEGAELQRPLAITLITGLIISTFVSLIAVPVFYTFFAGGEKLYRSN
jgi:hydrophobic/amphiphilic exporter-1 (mainly G- bacteria), HAE1 family